MQPTRHTVTIQEPGLLVTGCFGAGACTHRTQDAQDLPQRIASAALGVLHAGGAPSENGGPVPMHKTLKISISYCPNACARSQIADVGLIGAAVPAVPAVAQQPCIACGECTRVCREGAVRLDEEDRIASIDFDRCVLCGACAAACPVEAITVARQGFRLMLGGKLGRHPRFADELPGLFSPDELPQTVACAVKTYLDARRPGERMGDTVARLGASAFVAEAHG